MDMEKRLEHIASVLTYLLIATLLFTILIFIGGCGSDEKEAADPRKALFEAMKGEWTLNSVLLDEQEMQGFDEFSLVLQATETPFLYHYESINLPELSPWKAEGTWEFGSDIDAAMKRDQGTEDELDIHYELNGDELVIEFTFSGEGYTNGRVKSAEGSWVFVFSR